MKFVFPEGFTGFQEPLRLHPWLSGLISSIDGRNFEYAVTMVAVVAFTKSNL